MPQHSFFPDLPPTPVSIDWTPTRAAGLARLKSFLPSAGRAYANTRNTDFGPNDRSNISGLSPWLARRLITEEEVVAAVLAAHGFAAAEKFIQEVFWRTYWKGWLEMRPSVLVAFNRDRQALNQTVVTDANLLRRLERARNGHTGIDCFDAWVGELRDLGWLHNHARMWFASIWIFTLGLPWQLGADFFYKHLLDGDAASNTLSWRWVAGLHTKGKHYIARASNIATHSNGRFDPTGQLNEGAVPLIESYQAPGPIAPPTPRLVTANRVGLLLTQEDLHPQSLAIHAKVTGVACLSLPPIGDSHSPRNAFISGAMKDASQSASETFGVDVLGASDATEIVAWAKALGVTQIVTGYAPTGLVAWKLQNIGKHLADHDIALIQVMRDWDTRTWPLATGGFFKLKEKLPALVSGLTRP